MELPEIYGFSAFTSFPPVAIPMSVDKELQEDFDYSAFASLPPPAQPAYFLRDAITSLTHSTPYPPLQHLMRDSEPHSTHVSPPQKPIITSAVTPPLNPIIDRIWKDDVASFCLTYQLPATILGNILTVISSKPGHSESTGIIMLALLGLALLAFIAGKVVRYERPFIAAVAELSGILLSTAAFIYPMSVLFGVFGGSILRYVPLFFGVAVVGMYICRLATAFGSGDTDDAPVKVGNEERV